MFELVDVWYRYPGAEDAALSEVGLSFEPGLHTAVVGPNGAGKSTLLRVMLGRLHPERGVARFDGRPAASWARRALARRVAVVTQDPLPDLPIRVAAFVELGRNPYLAPWAALRAVDRRVALEAMALTGVEDLRGRDVSQLSAGELQRAKLARALAQEPEVLVLDEPTAHLDLGHELQAFAMVEDMVNKKGLTVVSVTHNLNLAARFAAQLVLLAAGRVIRVGSPHEVLVASVLKDVFGWPVRVAEQADGIPFVVPE